MTNQYNILSGTYCNILQLIYIHRRASYTTRYAYLHVSGSITRRTIYCTIYCNYRVRQYNILQYPLPPIQYIAIFFTDNTIYCNIRHTQYNILYCQDSPIQYIVNNILQYIVSIVFQIRCSVVLMLKTCPNFQYTSDSILLKFNQKQYAHCVPNTLKCCFQS
jgi:hypothetical protein